VTRQAPSAPFLLHRLEFLKASKKAAQRECCSFEGVYSVACVETSQNVPTEIS
jgi:hypothetical protein